MKEAITYKPLSHFSESEHLSDDVMKMKEAIDRGCKRFWSKEHRRNSLDNPFKNTWKHGFTINNEKAQKRKRKNNQ